MIDLILIALFSYMLKKTAEEYGVAAMPYVMNYIVISVIVIFALAGVLVYYYGLEALKTEEGMRNAMLFAPITLSVEVFLFIWFRQRIRKSSKDSEEEEDTTPDVDAGKKDLSYFR